MPNYWKGEYYRRKSANNWRNRRTGEVIVNNPKVITRKGQKNKIIINRGTRVLGVEQTKHHFYSQDKKPILITGGKLKKMEVRVRENNPYAKKPRVSHKRRL